jgi:uncharacterized protein YceH (UPF0502 family)
VDLTASEIRVLGCLIEKQRTTPDTYPLTLNALRVACNQATNRDPVVRYDDAAVRDAMTRLSRRRWARLAGGGRAPKYRHLLEEALTRAPDELAVLCVLMLRGPQTPGELKQRTDRLHPFVDLAAIHETLRRLIDRELVMQLTRRPGQKEERYAQRLGEDDDSQPATAPHAASPSFGTGTGTVPAPGATPAAPEGGATPAGPEGGATRAAPPRGGAHAGPPGAANAAPDATRAASAPSGVPEAPSPHATRAASAPSGVPDAPSPDADANADADAAGPTTLAADHPLERRVASLEAQVAELRAELRALIDLL